MYFGTANNYDGTGSTITSSGRYNTTATAGKNTNSNTWYVGENIQTTADAAKAAYIRLGTDTKSVVVNKNPAVGEEYITGGSYSFTYDVYLKNIALRRNNIYNITVNVSGTLERHLKLAAIANSGVSVKSTADHGGLNIGTLHGASSPKNQLLQPNTSGTTATDNIYKTWSNAKVYCAQLQLGGVAAGSWYLPSKDQLLAIYKKKQDINGYSSGAYYSAFDANAYWSSSEDSADNAWYVTFSIGNVYNTSKTSAYRVRCVRDLN